MNIRLFLCRYSLSLATLKMHISGRRLQLISLSTIFQVDVTTICWWNTAFNQIQDEQTIKRVRRSKNIMPSPTDATCEVGSAYPSVAPEITPSFYWGSCCVVFSFLCCVFCTIIYMFVFLFLAMALSVYFLSMRLTVPLVSFVPLLSLKGE